MLHKVAQDILHLKVQRGFIMARFKYKFWLDGGKDDELLLTDEIDQLKKKRLFTATLRDGIRLIINLRAGHLDVLVELFPWIGDVLKPANSPDTDSLRSEIAELKQMIREQGRAIPDSRDVGLPLFKSVGAAAPAPTVAVKAASVADAGAIADNFLAFIQ